jgi:hypothetical protein
VTDRLPIIYIQYTALNVVDPIGVLTIVGAPGGTKPVRAPQVVNSVACRMNNVKGSIKLRNVYWMSQLSDGSYNNDNFVGSSDGVHA